MVHDALFFSSFCGACERNVLAQRSLLKKDSSLVWLCLHCEAELDEQDKRSAWLTAEELSSVDCFIEGAEPEPKHGKEGGCRGGTCGVQQP